jgi:2-methylcitrate dehydratase PrpD
MQIAICAALKAYDGARPPSQVTIHAPVFRYCDRPVPRDGDDARFSFQYNVAIGLLDGAVGLDSHSEERLRCDDVQTLLRRTKLVLDPDITPSFDGMSVHVTTDDGRRGAADGWTGHWRYPATEEDHARKFDACARRLMPPEQAQSLRSLVDGIEGDGGLETLLEGLTASEAPLAR